MEMIEIVVIVLGVGNTVGIVAAYNIGWNSGYREGRKSTPPSGKEEQNPDQGR